jgi:hypothetical protein
LIAPVRRERLAALTGRDDRERRGEIDDLPLDAWLRSPNGRSNEYAPLFGE